MNSHTNYTCFFMKHLFTLLILLNLPTASGQSALEWVSLSHFDTIDLPGKKLVFKQLCTNSTDSITANGSATFLRAEIRNLGACSYSRSFTDTILSKVELFSSDKKSWDSFLAYFTTLVNRNYTVVPDKKQIRYVGYFVNRDKKVKAVFYGSKNRKKSQIVLTVAEN